MSEPWNYDTVMTPADRVLTWLMRINAVMLLFAVVAVFFPTDLMAECNTHLGLEPFHRSPLTEYLTRSISAMYAMHGAMVLAISTDVRRYRPLIRWVYVMHLTFAVTMVGIDLYAGMPTHWIMGEGGTIGTVAIAALLVNRWAIRSETAGE